MAAILDGKALSSRIRADLKVKLDQGINNGLPRPFLTTMQVGDDLPSTVYIRAKQRACEEIGIGFRHFRLPAETGMDALRKAVSEVNDDPSVHGLLVQSPLPSHLNEIEVQRMVAPEKDVDCFHPENVGLLYIGNARFRPCTAAGIIDLLLAYGFDPAGKNVVIIGRSVIVGRPLALMMMLKARGGNATVTVCHSRTRDLPSITRQADILVPAIGIAEMIRGDWVKEGVIVVDVGINRIPDATKKRGYRLVGDVAFREVEPKAEAIAPVPGGVGPMTVAILSRNVMNAAGYIDNYS
ncbi:MAG: bifunctional 5,10-methylenetetrahydrofolate dehydrogenase/5,10-methenyltetrahydrofolate cyclohydrolase [Candidatus Hatepunaea meridiana]|nr:bifunctional 5,10-methylenetetrahydrofolate dehydrogenase/5,10-methenyltetrahydrofolate cyclohydrolase [Candidatus Hatepunaea meridiana]